MEDFGSTVSKTKSPTSQGKTKLNVENLLNSPSKVQKKDRTANAPLLEDSTGLLDPEVKSIQSLQVISSFFLIVRCFMITYLNLTE